MSRVILLDPHRDPAPELAQLYFDRWRVEINLRHLKQTLHMDVLRSKTVDGIRKELCMIALVSNLVRLVMFEAAHQQGVPPDRISFVDALRWLTHARPDERLPKLTAHRNRHRYEPRVRKRRPKGYSLTNKPRARLREALRTQSLRA